MTRIGDSPAAAGSPVGAALAGLALLVALTGTAGACAEDDELSNPVPTVPAVLAGDPPADRVPGDPAPQDQASQDQASQDRLEPPNPAEPAAGPQPVALPDGNLAEVSIDVTVVMTLDAPIDMVAAQGDDSVWIAQREGQVLRVDLDRGQVIEVMLDIAVETTSDAERGLLGMAADEAWLYLDYTDLAGDTRVHAFERHTAAGATGLTGKRRELLHQPQPFSNHNGGAVEIGPEGHLHIGLGDGGSRSDPLDSGQDSFTWLGAVLRIDPTPDEVEPYSIPAGNPFAGAGAGAGGGAPEVFISGVRNPWRFSFDRLTGDLWIADVGQDAYEEVDLLPAAGNGAAGANLGWRLREGLHAFSGDRPAGNVDPVWEYGRDAGCSVTGGYVYRGSAIPELVGSYVFGDWCTARIWALSLAGGIVTFRDLGVDVPGGDLVAFGQDAAGELYTISLAGPIARIVGT